MALGMALRARTPPPLPLIEPRSPPPASSKTPAQFGPNLETFWQVYNSFCPLQSSLLPRWASECFASPSRGPLERFPLKTTGFLRHGNLIIKVHSGSWVLRSLCSPNQRPPFIELLALHLSAAELAALSDSGKAGHREESCNVQLLVLHHFLIYLSPGNPAARMRGSTSLVHLTL